MQFDWDDGNRAKVQKHGLTLDDIEFALAHGARFVADPAHSLTEQRFVAVSRTAKGRPVYIAFCWRDGRIRPISARATCTARRFCAMATRPTRVPLMTTDEEAEAFLEQDLSDLDYSQFKPLKWELFAKDARINMRLPAPLMAALKARAAERGIPYQRLIREALEREVGRKGA